MVSIWWESEFWQSDLVKDYGVVVVLALIVVGYIIYIKIKDKRRIKYMASVKEKQIKREQEEIARSQQQKSVEVPKPPRRDFIEIFGEGLYRERDVITRLGDLNQAVHDESKLMDTKIEKEFDMLSQELKEVHAKREQLKEHGLKLAKLYEKYGEREYELTVMMSRIEELIKKEAQLESR